MYWCGCMFTFFFFIVNVLIEYKYSNLKSDKASQMRRLRSVILNKRAGTFIVWPSKERTFWFLIDVTKSSLKFDTLYMWAISISSLKKKYSLCCVNAMCYVDPLIWGRHLCLEPGTPPWADTHVAFPSGAHPKSEMHTFWNQTRALPWTSLPGSRCLTWNRKRSREMTILKDAKVIRPSGRPHGRQHAPFCISHINLSHLEFEEKRR